MDENEKVCVTDLGSIRWAGVPVAQKADVLSVLEPLAGVDPAHWPKTRVKRWRMGNDMYAVPFWNGLEEWFVLFYPKEGRIYIEEVTSQRRAEWLGGRSITEMVGP